VKVPYSIQNNGTGSGSRVSVYIYERGKIHSTQEHVVGIHKPGKTISGFFQLRFPGNFSHSQMSLKVGVASDVDPLKAVDGFLEIGESASLEMEFVNNGQEPVDNISVRLTNLSGK